MWEKCFISSLLFFLCCNIGTPRAQSLDVYTTTLEEGRRAVEQDQPHKALEMWSAEAERHYDGITDPRIGTSYITLATQLELPEYYDRAVTMYYWGLKNPEASLFQDELETEIKRLQPIVHRSEYKEWRNLLKENKYQQLGQALQRFWRWMDPTPYTEYNERLIEHWLRIGHARKNYTRNHLSVYDADERAEIYVKYGEPDLVREGSISYNSMLVRMWVEEALNLPMPSVNLQSMGSDSLSSAIAGQQIAMQHRVRQSEIYRYERRVHFQHHYPSYEIWVYKDRDMSKYSFHPLIFIFGDEGDGGQFGQLRSVEEMMPIGSFRTSGIDMSIPPSFFLQMLYYQDLITVDSYFSQAYQDLESRLYSLNGVQAWESRSLWNQNRSKLQMTQLQAPEERSTLNEEIPEVELSLHQYRLLDENNEPYLATFLLSNPYRALFYDQVIESGMDLTSYSIVGSAMGINEQHNVLFMDKQNGQSLRHIQGIRGNVDNAPREITYFKIPNRPDIAEQKFTVELQHRKKDSTQVSNRLFKEHVRAIGSISGEQQDPISVDDVSLQMGDLIVGMRQEQGDTTLPFGFRVQPDARIPQGENLVVHLEIYHLQGSSGTPKPFQIEYVAKEDVGLLKRIFTKQEKVSLSLNFESRGPHFRENLEIDTSPFAPGDYTLKLTATEAGSDREVTGTIDFIIEEGNTNSISGN